MKCTRCGKNEANFHYVSNINGERTEKHLCEECAREEGYADSMNFAPMNISGFFNDMLEPMLSPVGAFDPFEDFGFSPMRAMRRAFGSFPEFTIRIGDGAAPAEEKKEEAPAAAPDEMSTKRELNVLKHSLEEAVKAEDFEKCITLRDQIRKLEGKGE